jgi:hypothetical protein
MFRAQTVGPHVRPSRLVSRNHPFCNSLGRSLARGLARRPVHVESGGILTLWAWLFGNASLLRVTPRPSLPHVRPSRLVSRNHPFSNSQKLVFHVFKFQHSYLLVVPNIILMTRANVLRTNSWPARSSLPVGVQEPPF